MNNKIVFCLFFGVVMFYYFNLVNKLAVTSYNEGFCDGILIAIERDVIKQEVEMSILDETVIDIIIAILVIINILWLHKMVDELQLKIETLTEMVEYGQV